MVQPAVQPSQNTSENSNTNNDNDNDNEQEFDLGLNQERNEDSTKVIQVDNINTSSDTAQVTINLDQTKDKVLLKFPRKIDSVKLKLRNPQTNEQPTENIQELAAENRQEEIPERTEQNANNLNSPQYEESQRDNYKKSNLNLHSCIIVRYPPPMWRKYYFPKGTSSIKFDKTVTDCNYKMLTFILKDFNRQMFQNVNKEIIQRELSSIYKQMYVNNRGQINKKWMHQLKGKFLTPVLKKRAAIEDVVMDDSYFITETDVMLLADKFNIPIVICLQSRGKIKVVTLSKYENMGYYYFVRCTKKNTFDLHLLKQSIKFDQGILPDLLLKNIQEQQFNSIEVYLRTQIKEFKKKHKTHSQS